MVLDVEQGGIEVPSFVGKTVRGAVEAAEDIGLELDAVGSGVAGSRLLLLGLTWPLGRGLRCSSVGKSKSLTTEDTEITEETRNFSVRLRVLCGRSLPGLTRGKSA